MGQVRRANVFQHSATFFFSPQFNRLLVFKYFSTLFCNLFLFFFLMFLVKFLVTLLLSLVTPHILTLDHCVFPFSLTKTGFTYLFTLFCVCTGAPPSWVSPVLTYKPASLVYLSSAPAVSSSGWFFGFPGASLLFCLIFGFYL